MNTPLLPSLRALAVAAALGLLVQMVPTAPALAQDAVKADPKHYKVEFENAQVRVLRIQYGAHEKSAMHGHPNSVAVFLTDGSVKFTLPDGKTNTMDAKAGTAMWTAAGKHLPENTGDKPFELILVELKHKAAAKEGAK
jgi:mannose-6-phosphate isomerase-like protein (cupin superfamily)